MCQAGAGRDDAKGVGRDFNKQISVAWFVSLDGYTLESKYTVENKPQGARVKTGGCKNIHLCINLEGIPDKF